MAVGIDYRPALGQKAGIGTYVAGLLAGLDQIGYGSQLVLVADSPVPKEISDRFRTQVFSPTPGWHWQVRDWVRKEKIVYHSTHSLVTPALVGRASVVTIHDLTALTLGSTQALKVKLLTSLFFNMAIRRSGWIITPTQAVRSQIVAKVPSAAAKTSVIYEAIEDDFGREKNPQILAKYQLKPGYLLFNGTLEPRKNLSRLITAYSKLSNPVPLVLAGKKGWGQESVEVLIRQHGLEDKVRLLGWVPDPDLAALYQGALGVVYPSLAEGFGLSPLRALKVQVPVLVSDIPVHREVLGESALYVDPLSTQSIQTGLETLVHNDDLRDSLVKLGRGQIELYSWQQAATQTWRVYQQISHEIG